MTLASIGDGVVRTDPEGAIDYLNPVAERLTGWLDGAAAIGRTVSEVFRVVDEITPPAARRSGRPLPGGEAGGRDPPAMRCC